MTKPRLSIFIAYSCMLLLLLGGTSCNTKKILNEGERLVKKNTVTLNFPKKETKVRNLKYELSTLAQPVPNTNVLFFNPRELIYYNNSQPDDTSKYRRYLKRVVAEEPAIFTEELAIASARDMKYYLENKGFFDAEVKYVEKNKGKYKKEIEYIANTGKRYRIDSVAFRAADPKISSILENGRERSKLVPGEPVSLNAYQAEVQRITRELKNNGYFDFNRNFIDTLRGDSTATNVNIYFEIFSPEDRKEHLIYTIGEVNVYPNYYPGDEKNNMPDTIIDNIHFRFGGRTLNIKPYTIVRSVLLKKGAIFQLDLLEKTKLQLNRLNNFRTISVIPKKDSIHPGVLHFDIYLNPKRKLEMGFDWELNNSNYTQQGDRNSLLGTSVAASYRNYNLFKNATQLDHRIQLGVELNLRQFTNPDSLIYSADASYNFNLSWPKYVRWIGPYKLLDRIKLKKDPKTGKPKKLIRNFYNKLRESAKTRWSVELSIRNISTLYLENSHNTSFGYELNTDAQNRFLITPTGFTLYFLARKTQLFEDIINLNPFLGLSTGNQLFTGLVFRNLSYTYNGKVNSKGESWFFNTALESSGHEVWAVNKIYNGIQNTQDTFSILNGFEFAQYAKLELDARFYRTFKGRNSFAFRANFGIAQPFGFSSRVPYIQQFYLGGGNSMRAWRIRELGPGAFIAPRDSSQNQVAFFQTGDVKIELNAEYRFKILGDFEGAIFFDIGNIWSLNRADTTREASQFHFIAGVNNGRRTEGFFNQMAIGTGFGIRWDFSYFILRADIGLKLRQPYVIRDKDTGNIIEDYWFPGWEKFSITKDLNLNLAIGYPF